MRRRYLVEGEVQGVGFRYFVERQARKLGIVGWVRNLADGRVEALGAGPAAQLAEFEAALRQGPPAASVTNLQRTEISDEADVLTSFTIR